MEQQNKSIEELLEELLNINLEIENLKKEINKNKTILEDLIES